jgi:CRISPR-associated protein Csy2
MYREVDQYLVLKDLKVSDYNAGSSYMTFGFPAINAILGFVKNLELKLKEKFTEFNNSRSLLGGVIIACNKLNLQAERDTYGDYMVINAKHPRLKDAKDRPIVNEIKASMNITLAIECFDNELDELEKKQFIYESLKAARIAGGTLDFTYECINFISDQDYEKLTNAVRKVLYPAKVIMPRHDLLADNDNYKNNLDFELEIKKVDEAVNINSKLLTRILAYTSWFKKCFTKLKKNQDGEDEYEYEWKSFKLINKDLVPVPLGFVGISKLYTEPSEIINSRNSSKPHQFVEPLIGLAEWLSSYAFEDLADVTWQYYYDKENSAYLNVSKAFIKENVSDEEREISLI